MLHAKAQSAKAEDRVVLADADDLARQFLAAEVEGADHAFARGERFRQRAVKLQVLLFGRQQRALGDVQKLRPVESNALRAESHGVLQLLH